MKTYSVDEGSDVIMTITVHTYPAPAHFEWTTSHDDVIQHSSDTSLENDTSVSTVHLYQVTSSTKYNVEVWNNDRSMCSSYVIQLEVTPSPTTEGIRFCL